MSCREFESIVTDLARSPELAGATLARGIAHARQCPRCAARLETERRLSLALRALAASGPAGAPDSTERALLAAFRAQAAPRGIRAGWRRLAGWGAAAAAAGLLVALWSGAPEPRPVNAPPVERIVPAPEVATVEPAPPAVNPAPRRKPGAVRPTRTPERPPEFIPLPWASEPAFPGDLYVTRLRVPRATLVAAGLPMNMERADEAVQADVVFTVDGRARAIRILR